jgi:broad specificity phosphatase PhoE
MESTETAISFIRHGNVHNPASVVYGRLPGYRLSALGRRQVGAAAEHLRSVRFDRFVCSPLLRAQETAQIVRRYHPAAPFVSSESVNEVRTYFEGLPERVLEARGWDMYTGIGGVYERPGEIAGRMRAFVQELLWSGAGGRIAVVTHGDPLAFAIVALMGGPLTPAEKNALKPYGITDGYPATGSVTTLIYRSGDVAERPELFYVRPYGDELFIPQLGPGPEGVRKAV